MALVTVAAVQAAPVFLDRDATVDKACALVREAGRAGARLVAFPEVFVPGFPHWIYLDRPQANEGLFVELVREAVDVPSPATEALGRAAREADAYVVIGINERSRRSAGELFNTNLIFSPDGALLGWHRKLMPTYAEKMIWSFGDGSTLCVYDTQIGRLGTLCCGENTNPLARFALIAQGEQIHVANYPARPAGDAVDLRYNIQIRSAAHAFEGNCFVVAAGSFISREMRERLGDTAEKRKLLGDGSQTFTGVLGPDGKVIAGPAADDTEAIVYGSIDLEVIVRQKIHHDVAGNYNRFDVLSLVLNRAPLTAIREIPAPPVEPPAAEATPQAAERAHEPIIFDSRSSGPSATLMPVRQEKDPPLRPATLKSPQPQALVEGQGGALRDAKDAASVDVLMLVCEAAYSIEVAESELDLRRRRLAEAMRVARENHSLAEVAKAAGISREWVRRLTQ